MSRNYYDDDRNREIEDEESESEIMMLSTNLESESPDEVSLMMRQQRLMMDGYCPNCDPPIKLTEIEYRTYQCCECHFVGYGSFGETVVH